MPRTEKKWFIERSRHYIDEDRTEVDYAGYSGVFNSYPEFGNGFYSEHRARLFLSEMLSKAAKTRLELTDFLREHPEYDAFLRYRDSYRVIYFTVDYGITIGGK